MFIVQTAEAKWRRKFCILMGALFVLSVTFGLFLTMHVFLTMRVYGRPRPPRSGLRIFGIRLTP
jgi:hypothetical protein